ncbi:MULTISPECIES: SRPBCC family protein [Arthrobacter]|uniref:SRPBCC domain-containing protein n=1 Tax=Arthrobacter caoxuetaonis TaxID=2886935 RepID=A0A9X1MFD8_9MICC|nr:MULTISPECIES: SRPBCC family protein [Arthrobacter]MCC3281724.1 SRPBCC domain-containing protein [Arthrobacter caoxuetaonis]MCC3298606.1 SRPBCC domain-containing protein [Arthrobacter caoxuetaonis]MCC9194833.1 SRPBCC domain-containing protein [Arthrobacter sp. zg-Y916]USQ57347.1 SRPBCC family protein [Arthrobacter caoxuetaonis]
MSNEQSTISVSRVIDAPAGDIFHLLSNPERHHELDGSGMVVSDEKTDRIAKVGDVFTMNMNNSKMGEYKTDNHVTGFDHNKLLAWKTAVAGTEPAGWEWMWELASMGPDSTEVTLTYDWSKVTDKETLKKVSFPMVSKEELEASLNKLAAAVSGS